MMCKFAVAVLLVSASALKITQDAPNNNRDKFCEKDRLLPSVHLLGAQKAGSTSLYKDLIRRFDISPAEVLKIKGKSEADWMAKEVSFFADEPRFKKGRGFYLRHFPHCKDVDKTARAIDASIALDHGEAYVNRLADFYGEKAKDLKFIVIVRDPIKRLESEFHHGEQMIGNEFDTGGLTKKVQDESQLEKYLTKQLKEDGAAMKWKAGDQKEEPPQYFHGSAYAYMLKHWLTRFDGSQFTVITLKQYQQQTPKVLKFLSERLGMPQKDTNEMFEHVLANENKNHHKPMNLKVRMQLEKFFEPLDDELKEIVDKHKMGMPDTTLMGKTGRAFWEKEAHSPRNGRKLDQEWEGLKGGKLYGSGY